MRQNVLHRDGTGKEIQTGSGMAGFQCADHQSERLAIARESHI